MFGYIAINKGEMKFKDFDVYHAYYCGLCHCLKDQFGSRGQATLSYDMTFLAVLLSALYEPESQKEVTRCIAHPFEKHVAIWNEYSSYAADINIILSYYKSKDDWDDERKKKSLLTCKLLESKVNLIRNKYPEKISLISSKLQEISALEKENSQDIDLMAGLFGDIMAECFVCYHDEWEGTLRRMGFFLGKYIYLMDAYEDIEDDLKKGCYNPLKNLYENQSPKDFAANCRTILTMMMAECSRSFEQLPILLHAEILRNVLYSGVWSKYTQVTRKRLGEDEIPESNLGKD